MAALDPIADASPFRHPAKDVGLKRLHPPPQAGNAGFTLIEVMICTCIIGVLSAIGTPFYLGFLEKARTAVAITDMKAIETAVADFIADNAALPNTLVQIGKDNLRDPWGRPYQYIRIDGMPLTGPGKVTPRKDHFMHPINDDFDLCSMGPDGKSEKPLTAMDSRDDIIRAYNGGYYGKVSDM